MSFWKRNIGAIAALALAVALNTSSPAHAEGEPAVPVNQRILAKPVIDAPMREPSVCRGPDGMYYLTGATPRATDQPVPSEQLDWQNNTTIRLWKSKDCQNWEEIGVVFGFRDFRWSPQRGHNYNWAFTPRPLAGVADSPRHYLGFTSPKIHYLKDTFWLAFSMNGMGTGLAKSTSGKPEGPYVLWGKGQGNQAYITTDGADPSLFQDDDGSVYWLWSPAWIAKMKDDLTGLAEAPKMLTCEPRGPMGTDVLVGERGPFMFKANGLYHLTAAALMPRLGVSVQDTFIATSKTIAGPYSKRFLMIPHGGPTTVFQDEKGGWHATFCGRDRYAAFRDRAGIVPLEKVKRSRWANDKILGINTQRVYTERGPWHKLQPILDKPGMNIRDMNMIQAPDGSFYFTGSVYGEAYKGKLTIFRSKDLKNWDEIVVRTFADETDMPENKRNYRTANNSDWNNYYMDCEIHYLPAQKNFFITGYAYVGIPVVLRSTSGKGEGPYELIGRYGAQLGYFEDDDGKEYMHGGVKALKAVKPDLSGFAEGSSLPSPNRVLGGQCAEDSGAYMVKMHGKYVYFSCGCSSSNAYWIPQSAGNYDFLYTTADSVKGPWSQWMPGGVRNGGHGGVFRGLDGHWYGVVWDGMPAFGFHDCLPGMVRLKTELKDGQVLIDVDDDWTPADYKPVTEWKGEGTFSPYTDTAKGPAAKK